MPKVKKSPPRKSTLPPSRSPPVGNRPVSESQRRAYRVNEFCDAWRVSRQTAYDLMNSGKLPYFHVGQERRIPVEGAEALAQQPLQVKARCGNTGPLRRAAFLRGRGVMEKDQASQVYGSLKTEVHHAGYSLERAMAHLEWILQKDRWKGVGNGFKDINNFLETLRLGDNNVQSSIDQRKRIVKLIKTLQPEASNRQIAKTVGVGSSTVNRVVAPNGAPTAENPNETNDAERTTAPNGAPGLSAIVEPPTLSGAEVVRLAQRQEAKAESAGRAEQRRQESRSAPPLPDGMDLRIGDCRDVLADIKDSSVALVLTDPPYAEEAEPLYRWLAKWAARVLIPGGSLICYTGHWSLNRDIRIFDEHLRYWWALAMLHHQSRRLPGKFVIADFKPVLWYVKEFRRGKTLVSDVLEPPKREKDDHEWGQGEGGVTPLIEHLAQPGELIADPFAGTAKWGEIAASMGRRWVGSDLVLGGSTEIAA